MHLNKFKSAITNLETTRRLNDLWAQIAEQIDAEALGHSAAVPIPGTQVFLAWKWSHGRPGLYIVDSEDNETLIESANRGLKVRAASAVSALREALQKTHKNEEDDLLSACALLEAELNQEDPLRVTRPEAPRATVCPAPPPMQRREFDMSEREETGVLGKPDAHPYYCNEGNYYANGCVDVFRSWDEFVAEWGDSDLDYNLVFRWDLIPVINDDGLATDQPPMLLIFFMQQRKGRYCSCRVESLPPADQLKAREWLEVRWKHMQRLWAPISPPTNPVSET